MIPETASRLVGLIAVDVLPHRQNHEVSYSPDSDATDARDATLDQFLLFLTGGTAFQRGARPDRSVAAPDSQHGPCNLPGGRFEQVTSPDWPQPTRLAADLKALTAQLDLAVAEARRQVAVALRLWG